MRPTTTATIMAKGALTVAGLVITIIGFIVRTRGYGSLLSTEPTNPELARVGAWILVVGAVWLILTVAAWLITPGVWDAIAPFLVGLILSFSILATLLLSAALTLTGRPAIIDPTAGVAWRLALTVAVVAISFAQVAIAQALVGREPPVPTSGIWRLRASGILVLVLGAMAAWSSPPPLVAALTMASLVYITIELVPRGT
ncbi:MAG: hypothetical protein ACFCVC_09290 [Acidimicrobiia bacterium]